MTIENNNKIDKRFLLQRIKPPFNRVEIFDAFEKIVSEIKPHMHLYDTIVGDDASGRLPTLVMANLIGRKRIQQGLSSPSVFFLSGGTNIANETVARDTIKEISDLIDKDSNKEKRKILIVTEYMNSGESMRILVDEFNKHSVFPDICTLETQVPAEIIWKGQKGNLYSGSSNTIAGKIFFVNSQLSGVESVFGSAISKRKDLSKRDFIETIEAHKDMRLIAEELWKIVN